MKKTLKKVLCTTLAAVSLTAFVAIPSTVNTPTSKNSLINVIKAEATNKVTRYHDYSINKAIKFEVICNTLNGRSTPDGSTIFKLNINDKVWINKIRYEQYGNEYRIWGYTENTYYCNGKNQHIWVCLSRAIYDADKHRTTFSHNCKCVDDTYKNKMNAKILQVLNNPDYYLDSHRFNYITCYVMNGDVIVSW